MMHLPPLWKFRLLRALKAKGSSSNRQLLAAWALAEGGRARWNPLNTTEWWPGSWDYNTAHVKNYRRPADGLAATLETLLDGYYPGIVRDLRAGTKTARQIVADNAAEFDKWGTGSTHVLACL